MRTHSMLITNAKTNVRAMQSKKMAAKRKTQYIARGNGRDRPAQCKERRTKNPDSPAAYRRTGSHIIFSCFMNPSRNPVPTRLATTPTT